MNKYDLILASASPRRAQLLRQLGWNPQTIPVDIDESIHLNEPAIDYCLRMAVEKSTKAQGMIETKLPLITADTIVVLDQEILGKPESSDDALLTLIKLSGREHQVYSSVCVCFQDQCLTDISQNKVFMSAIGHEQMKAYISTGEPMDKAGAYGIQGYAAMWIKYIEGSYSSIMGLPLYETTKLLAQLKVDTPLNKPIGS